MSYHTHKVHTWNVLTRTALELERAPVKFFFHVLPDNAGCCAPHHLVRRRGTVRGEIEGRGGWGWNVTHTAVTTAATGSLPLSFYKEY